jgi:hypothetical protein
MSEGRYIGKIVWTPLPDGRLMKLIEAFGFVDPAGLNWPVPAGTEVDGASIPQSLWSIVGSPFTGKYRDASVIHDYYCDVHVRAWQAVHRVFYDAMIAGVEKLRAKLMYAAVYFAGPTWGDTAVRNNRLQRPDLDYFVNHSPFELGVMNAVEVSGTSVSDFLRSREWVPPKGSETRLHLKELEKLISEYDPSPDAIASALDDSTGPMESLPLVRNKRTLVVEPVPDKLPN